MEGDPVTSYHVSRCCDMVLLALHWLSGFGPAVAIRGAALLQSSSSRCIPYAGPHACWGGPSHRSGDSNP